MGCVYLIEGPAGKNYVGITLADVDVRFKRHIHQANGGRACAISAALRKYGPEQFKIIILAHSDDTKELRRLERAAIQEHGTLSPGGYNLTGGGEDSGFWSPESREKLVASLKRSWLNPSEKQRRAREGGLVRMQKALSDPVVEAARRAKISSTMKASGIGKGEKNASSKITEETARAIKVHLAEGGRTQTSIASQYGISRRLVGFIASGQRWAHA